LPIAAQVFELLSDRVNFFCYVQEGEHCEQGQLIARVEGPLDALLTGERVALNLAMRLSGIDSRLDLPTY
jgi:nicotinate-nucleotide pyrophosphorylase (carboxylating)